ncbi:MAG: hypothetical protein Q8N61_01380 [bacterium]|nr:hypothetical protein [bacterium]
MALYLGDKFTKDYRRRPPGFEAAENEIWQAFLETLEDAYIGFWYNVKLGLDRITAEQRKDPVERMKEQLALKRIDAIGHRTNVYDLIEVRRHAGPGSLGQLFTYEALWLQYGLTDLSYTMLLVTDFIDIDTLAATKTAGIVVINV